MGQYEVYQFLKDRPGQWFDRTQISKELNRNVGNIGKSLIHLSGITNIHSRCTNKMCNVKHARTVEYKYDETQMKEKV